MAPARIAARDGMFDVAPDDLGLRPREAVPEDALSVAVVLHDFNGEFGDPCNDNAAQMLHCWAVRVLTHVMTTMNPTTEEEAL
jgi:hypothetical protein